MFGGLNRLLAAAIAVGAVFVAPSAALACNGGPSAVNVYKECVQTGGGEKPTNGGTQTSTGSTPATISPQAAHALKHAGKDRRILARVVRGFGTERLLQSDNPESASAPSAIGSAFDLGSGPTALLIVLAGTAVLLLGFSGTRSFRHRRR